MIINTSAQQYKIGRTHMWPNMRRRFGRNNTRHHTVEHIDQVLYESLQKKKREGRLSFEQLTTAIAEWKAENERRILERVRAREQEREIYEYTWDNIQPIASTNWRIRESGYFSTPIVMRNVE